MSIYNPEKKRENSKRYYAKNRDAINARRRKTNRSEKDQKYYEANKDKINARVKKYRDKNKAEINRRAREDYGEQNRSRRYKRYYNITINDYNIMYTQQNGKCKICLSFYPLLHVDHDHSTGNVRGLLCNKCNLGIGHLQDNICLLKNAIKYLEDNLQYGEIAE